MCKQNNCNHNKNDENTTLIKIHRKEMIYPPQDKYYCDICHNFFIFPMEEN